MQFPTSVRPTHAALSPSSATLTGGLLLEWQRRNRDATIPHGIREFHTRGHIANFENLLAGSPESHQGREFNDSDVYKALEAIAWSGSDPAADAFFDRVVTLLEKVQDDSGYLNTYYQHPRATAARWTDFAQGHELYCMGHLVQAGVAASRNGRGDRLLEVATRFADHAVEMFAGTSSEVVPGHPGVEMALVELYRHTGQARYLDLAGAFIDRRGHGWLGGKPFGSHYYLDALPLREMSSVAGHCVRAMYLFAGATDVAMETRDAELLDTLEALWTDMAATKLYLTGGIGSRHRDEAFGDSYELPTDRAYAETCAAVGLMQWSYRLLIATGHPRYAEMVETVLLNGFASGISESGTAFFYSNPLQRRSDHLETQEEGAGRRLSWFDVSCCPPNIMRVMASLSQLLATSDPSGIQVHVPSPAIVAASTAQAGDVSLRVRSEYPWEASASVEILSVGSDADWTLALRLPARARDVRVTIAGREASAAVSDGYVRVHRGWRAGDLVAVHAVLSVDRVLSHPCIDATRGCSAIRRGPIVYCAEAVDQTMPLDRYSLDGDRQFEVQVDDASRPVRLDVPAVCFESMPAELYPPVLPERRAGPESLRMVPYYTWGNRNAGAMRVWVP